MTEPTQTRESKHINDRPPNFYNEEGKFFLVRCFACDATQKYGRENWLPAVASGKCAWCNWKVVQPVVKEV